MRSAAKSLTVFGVYLLFNAAMLLLLPNVLLGLFGLPATQDPWIRVLGLVVGVLGYYYVFAARHSLSAFYPATVWGRAAAALTFVGLVLAQLAPAQLLLFGAVDALAAWWTYRAIASDARA